ncbi:hypothetical protein LAZ67_3004583 [Cordylochernes scorpioides]|uniref:Reverse transcriptase domain-containing protein n=1 Tax=Cordylochernes scorpioides TaxID=51811 RepID=A0ABY6K9H6_9ARAC|nr:hypothetical protein LAZ67_3004583 [Cordylochernes scorpioides]
MEVLSQSQLSMTNQQPITFEHDQLLSNQKKTRGRIYTTRTRNEKKIGDRARSKDDSDLPGIYLPGHGTIHLLLFADDIVLFGESKINLQIKINLIKIYFEENGLTLNQSKSKIVVFRNGGRLARSDVWFWGQQPMTISSKYTYLGYPLTTKNPTAYVAQHFKSKALVATNAVWRILSKSRTKSFGAVMKLLDSIVLSTLLYSAKLWATNQIRVVNQIQDIFLRRFLDFPKFTPGYILRTETGRMSLELNITKLILNFWIRILKMDRTRLPYVCLSQLWKVSIVGKAGNNFIHNLNSIIDSRGFSFLKNCEDYMVVRGEMPRIIQTTVDHLLQFDRAKLQNSTHFIHYQSLSISFTTEDYLLSNLPLKIKRFITRQRILWLLFREDITGFWNSDYLNCYFCNVGIQDNLVHYLFHCPFLHEKRLEIREISGPTYYNEQHGLPPEPELHQTRPIILKSESGEETPAHVPSAYFSLQQPRCPSTFSGDGSEDAQRWLKDYKRIVNITDGTILCVWRMPYYFWPELNGSGMRIMKIAQKANESSESYIQDVLYLCQLIDPRMDNETKLGHLMKGVAEDVYQILIARDVDNVEQFLRQCRKIELLKKRRITTKKN